MQAGKLRQRLTVQEPNVHIRLDGSQDVSFRDVMYNGAPLTVYGRIEPLSMVEFVIAGQDTSRTYVKLTVRYFPGLLPTMRFVDAHDNRVFEITGVLNKDSRNREISILATEKLEPST
jgi:head-tail adaptor